MSERRLREFQEIKIAKDGRGIILLHNASAGASWILSLDFAVGFHQNNATTRWVDAMPAFSGFHDHGPFFSLRKNDRMSAKAIVGRARDVRRATVNLSKLKSKRNFNAQFKYITSTSANRPELEAAKTAAVRHTFAFKHPLPEERMQHACDRRNQSGGCEGGVRLLKFDVCWDAAVCAVSAGGFFSVWNGVRETISDLSYRPDPLELFRVQLR